MISKRIYIQIIIRVLGFLLSTLLFAFIWYNKVPYILYIISILIILQVIELIKYLNKTNRKIAYFFEAIKNEDFTLKFSKNDASKSLNELNQSLNKVNTLIQEIQIKKQSQELYYQEILKQVNVGILTLNASGHILFANESIKKLFHYEQLNHIRQIERINDELYKLLKTLKPFERELFHFSNERENNQLVIKSNKIELHDESLMLVVFEDINAELDQKETDSWMKLIRVLTHEIMNTIAPITSIAESLSKSSDLDYDKDKIIKGLRVIKEQSNNLTKFVHSYRSILNLPKPDKEIILIKDLFKDVKSLMQKDIEDNDIDFKVECNPETLEFFADKKQITQVLLNLIKNAIQALSKKETGQIVLKSGITVNQEKYIKVVDNGPGVSEELLEQIFIPFFTTKKEGTGVGLSLSKQILRLHGGSLDVKSTLNEGTLFKLKL